MNRDGELTYSEAIEQVMLRNGFFAPLKLLYKEIWDFKDKSKIVGKTPDYTIQERVQRDPRFARIAKGVYALTDFLESIEKQDSGYFTIEKEEVVFKETKKLISTEKFAQQKVRLGQSYFRTKLLSEMKRCPITEIDDQRLLVASHIKPWVHSDNDERISTKNGILLSPLFDKLFDKGIGLITFTPEKRILISNRLSKDNLARLNVSNDQVIINLDTDGREEFLDYHRKFIYQG